MSQAGRSQRPRRVDPTRVAGADHAFPAREEVLFGKFKLACTLVLALSTSSFAADAPGVTATEIRIGGVFPFSGPASAKYLFLKGVPTISIISGSNKFTGVAEFPLTTTGLVSFDTEGKIYAKYL